MDVEKAIQGLIEADIRAQKRADKFDKQLKATADLVRAGVKLVMKDRKLAAEERKLAAEERKKQAERNKELDFKLNALIDSQNRTDERMRKFDKKWDRWLDELRKNRGNGHS